jgi:hypothetical protein
MAVVVDTNLYDAQYKAVDRIIGRFPIGDQIKEQLRRQLEQGGTSFSKDVRPLLGNPAVIGAPDTRAVNDNHFVGALVVKDSGKLDELLKRPDVRKVGESSGATLYETQRGTDLGVEGDTVVLADSRAEVERALRQHDDGNGLDQKAFDRQLSGLPQDALVKVAADARAFLRADPSSAQARRVKWVDALRSVGTTISASSDRATVDFRIATDPAGLGKEDLPLAAGNEAPRVVQRPGEVGVGIRDAAQIVEFAQRAARSVNPVGFGGFERSKEQIKHGTKVDLDRDLVSAFTGEATASVAVDGRFGLRAPLKDPAAFRRTLARLARVVPSFVEGAGGGTAALARPRGRNGFYAVSPADGRGAVYGVVGDAFVAASDPRHAGALVAAKPSGLPDAQGSLVFHGDAQQLAQQLISRRLSGLSGLGAGVALAPLAELQGWVKTDTDGMRGRLSVGFD